MVYQADHLWTPVTNAAIAVHPGDACRGYGCQDASTTSLKHAGFSPSPLGAPPALIDTVRLSGAVFGLDGLDVLGRLRKSRQIIDLASGEVDDFPYWSIDGVAINTYKHGGLEHVIFEASLPKRRRGSNVQLLPLRQGDDEVRKIYSWLGQHVRWRCEPEDLRVHRLDASLDFQGVTSLDYLIRGLAGIPVAWERTSPAIYADPERGHAITLARGSRTTDRASLYSKAAEVNYRLRQAGSPDPASHPDAIAARDVARFEAQLRSPFLKTFGVAHWGEVTEERITAMRRDSFEKRHFDRPVVSGLQLIKVMREQGISPARQAGIFYDAVLLSLGEQPQGDRGTQAQRRRDLENLRVAVGEPLQAAPRVWLDYQGQCQRSEAESN